MMKQIRIKKWNLLLLVFAGLLLSTQAAIVMYDGMDYAAGDINGKGGWTKIGTRDLIQTDGSLTYGYLATSGGKISIQQGDMVTSDYTKEFTDIVLSNTGDSMYFSFLMNVRNTATGDNKFAIHLNNDAETGQIQTVDDSAAGIKGWFNQWVDIQETAPFALSDGVHLIVGQFINTDLAGTANNYVSMRLWIDPTDLSSATANGTYGEMEHSRAFGDVTVQSISILNKDWGETETADLDIDEIRIGMSWADVTPTNATLSPSMKLEEFTETTTTDTGANVGYTQARGTWGVYKDGAFGNPTIEPLGGNPLNFLKIISENDLGHSLGRWYTVSELGFLPGGIYNLKLDWMAGEEGTGQPSGSETLKLALFTYNGNDTNASRIITSTGTPTAGGDSVSLLAETITTGVSSSPWTSHTSESFSIAAGDDYVYIGIGYEGFGDGGDTTDPNYDYAGIDNLEIETTFDPSTPRAKIALNSFFCSSPYLQTVHRNFFKKLRSYENDQSCTRLFIETPSGSSTGSGSITVTIDGTNYVTAISSGEKSYVIAGKVALTLYESGLKVMGVVAKSATEYGAQIHLPTETVTISDSLSGIITTVDSSLQKNFHVDETGNLIDNASKIYFYPRWPNGVYDLTWTGTGSVKLNTYQDGLDAEYPTANSAIFTLSQGLDTGTFTNLPYTTANISVEGIPQNVQAFKRDDPYTGNIRNAAIDHALAYGSAGLRFLGIELTINHDMRGWSKRPLTNSPSYSITCPTLTATGGEYYLSTGGSGIPWEDQVEYANACYAINPEFEPWFCLPSGISQAESALIRDLLDEFNGPVYTVEYSNELWNPAFSDGQLILKHAADSGRTTQEQTLFEAATTLAAFTNSPKALPIFAWGTGQWNNTLEDLIANNYAGIKDVIQAISEQPYVVTDTTKSNDYLFEKNNPQPGSYWDPNPGTNPIDITAARLQINIQRSKNLGLAFEAYEGFNLHNTGSATRGFEISVDPRYEEVERHILETLMPIMPVDSRAYVMNSIGGNEWGILKYGLQPPEESPQARALLSYAAAHQPPPPAGSYEAWILSIEWNGANSTNTADPDNDALSNLIEYAMDLDPVTPDEPPTSLSVGAQAAGLTYRRSLTASEIVWKLYVTDSLLNSWSHWPVDDVLVSSEQIDSDVDGDQSAELMRYNVSLTPEDQSLFFRIDVEEE